MDKKEKQKLAYIKWRNNHKEEYLEKQNELSKKYYYDNREKVLEKKKEYYKNNRDHIIEMSKQRYIKNKSQNDLKTTV